MADIKEIRKTLNGLNGINKKIEDLKEIEQNEKIKFLDQLLDAKLTLSEADSLVDPILEKLEDLDETYKFLSESDE